MAFLERIPVLFGLALAHGLSITTDAATRYVAGPGQSITAAIAAAAEGDSIVVAPGNYVEAVKFGGKKVTVVSEAGPQNTILKAPDGTAPAIDFGAGATRASVLRGLSIVNSEVGVGIRSETLPTVVGNMISNCNVGISCSGSAFISSNIVTACGTALGIFANPNAPNAVVEDNVVEKNNVGVQANVAGASVFRRNIFRRQIGHAVWIQFGEVDFVDNIVSENGSHGMVADLGLNQRIHILHNLFWMNGLVAGSAITITAQYGQSVIANNIIMGDYGIVCGPGGNSPLPTIANNNVLSTGNHAYSGRVSDLTGQFGNIAAAPQFLNVDLRDYRLLSISPEVDRGSATNTVEMDFDKRPRAVDGDGDGEAQPDMGPFEYTPGPPRPATSIEVTVSDAAVGLNWTAFDLATSYRILRSTSASGPFESISTNAETHFEDTSGIKGTVYFYAIAGSNTFGFGEGSTAVRVRFGNHSPTPAEDVIQLDEDSSIDFDLLANDTDFESDPLIATLVETPQNGAATLNGSVLHYVPYRDFSGTDIMRYRVSDGFYGVSTGVVTIVVRPVNDVPKVEVAVNEIFAESGSTLVLPLAVSDPDNTTFSFHVTRGPTNGVAEVAANGEQIVYRSRHLYLGPDSVSFFVSDGIGQTPELTAFVTVVQPFDWDGDGMADFWENEFDLNNPTRDRDQDGVPNRLEYLAGTSPIDPNSLFKFVSINVEASGIRVSWKSVGGVRYRVCRAEALSADGVFSEIVRSITEELDPSPIDQLSTNSFFDGVGGSGFYRIKVIP